VWSPWSRFLEQRKLRELDSGDGVLNGSKGEVGKHEGHESYLWIGSVEAGVTGGGAGGGRAWSRRRCSDMLGVEEAR
jgi:hypothetical protein